MLSTSQESRSSSRLKCLFVKRPEFVWSHPFSLLLQEIPALLTAQDLHESIIRLLMAKSNDPLISQSIESACKSPSSFADLFCNVEGYHPVRKTNSYEKVYKKSNSTGWYRTSSEKLAWIAEEIDSTEADLKEAARRAMSNLRMRAKK
jgi:hypothetical protein